MIKLMDGKSLKERLLKDKTHTLEKDLYKQKKMFVFGVDYLGDNFINITVNRKISVKLSDNGISLEGFAIVIGKGKPTDNGKFGRIFYAERNIFEEMKKECKQISDTYATIYVIPDVWFSKTEIVKFISSSVMRDEKFQKTLDMTKHMVFGT